MSLPRSYSCHWRRILQPNNRRPLSGASTRGQFPPPSSNNPRPQRVPFNQFFRHHRQQEAESAAARRRCRSSFHTSSSSISSSSTTTGEDIDRSNGGSTTSSRSSSSSSSSSATAERPTSSTPLSSLIPTEYTKEFALPKNIPDVIKLQPGQRLVAIGDVHGDFDQLCSLLETAQVMDGQFNWIGGTNTICVQCGDVLDRGDRELECFRLLATLARQASEESSSIDGSGRGGGGGGALTLLYGNHECLNMEGWFNYAWEEGNEEFEKSFGPALDSAFHGTSWRKDRYAENEPCRWAALEPGGLLAQPLLSQMKVAIIVGRSVLVHGGLTLRHLKEYGDIGRMNQAARDWVLRRPLDDGEGVELSSSSQAEGGGMLTRSGSSNVETHKARSDAIFRDMPTCLGGGNTEESSPVWARLYSHPCDMPPTGPGAQDMIDYITSTLDVDRMIVGHTPQKRINGALQNKVWRIDVGVSKGIDNGTPEVLEVMLDEESGEEVVTILTVSGERIPAHERQATFVGGGGSPL